MNKDNILLIFKDRKKVTKNNDFWFEKFNHKYEVEILFINDYLNLSNNEIINGLFILIMVPSARLELALPKGQGF